MAVVVGFVFGIGVKLYVQFAANPPSWLAPYANQAAINWVLCVLTCVFFSLTTAPPRPEQISDQFTLNWKRLNIFENLGTRWYTSVVTWWALFVLAIFAAMLAFSELLLG